MKKSELSNVTKAGIEACARKNELAEIEANELGIWSCKSQTRRQPVEKPCGFICDWFFWHLSDSASRKFNPMVNCAIVSQRGSNIVYFPKGAEPETTGQAKLLSLLQRLTSTTRERQRGEWINIHSKSILLMAN